jgi:hypothetical protein
LVSFRNSLSSTQCTRRSRVSVHFFDANFSPRDAGRPSAFRAFENISRRPALTVSLCSCTVSRIHSAGNRGRRFICSRFPEIPYIHSGAASARESQHRAALHRSAASRRG